jgi:ribonuclease VapC
VLDSYALLAYLRAEAGGERVRDLLAEASRKDRPLHMTEVNYAEVKYMVLRKDKAQAWRAAAAILPALPVEFHEATRELADLAADLKARHPISLADAFAAALAQERNAELITGDPEFKAVEGEVKILWLQ